MPIIGTTTLKGDKPRIMLKIPLMSVALTIVGLLLLRLLVVVAMVSPVERLRMPEDADKSVAQQYVRLRQHDEYPRQIFDRGLKLRNGKRVALDNYVVDTVTLRHARGMSKKIVL